MEARHRFSVFALKVKLFLLEFFKFSKLRFGLIGHFHMLSPTIDFAWKVFRVFITAVFLFSHCVE